MPIEKSDINEIIIKQTISTLSMFGIVLEKSKTEDLEKIETVTIHIPVIGDISGDVQILFTKNFALSIANTMLGGMVTLTEIDDMAKSTLGEIGNMISGAVSTELSTSGIMTDIQPPQFLDSTITTGTMLCSGNNHEFIQSSFV